MKEICKKVEEESKKYFDYMVEQGAEHCYCCAYEIAMMEELIHFFTDYVYNLDDESDLDMIKKYDKLVVVDDLCSKIILCFRDFRHPERFNFFEHESLFEIIDEFIKINGFATDC